MEPMSDYAQLQLRFVDSVQRRYEVIQGHLVFQFNPDERQRL
jgi:hypothetical protein